MLLVHGFGANADHWRKNTPGASLCRRYKPQSLHSIPRFQGFKLSMCARLRLLTTPASCNCNSGTQALSHALQSIYALDPGASRDLAARCMLTVLFKVQY